MTLEKVTINIGEQERQCVMFTTIAWVKDLNGLRFQLSFSYDRYEKMEKLACVIIINGGKLLENNHNEHYL